MFPVSKKKKEIKKKRKNRKVLVVTLQVIELVVGLDVKGFGYSSPISILLIENRNNGNYWQFYFLKREVVSERQKVYLYYDILEAVWLTKPFYENIYFMELLLAIRVDSYIFYSLTVLSPSVKFGPIVWVQL